MCEICIKEKKCNKCGIIKDIKEFYYWQTKDYYRSICRGCDNKHLKEKRDLKRGYSLNDERNNYKICKGCNVLKLKTEFKGGSLFCKPCYNAEERRKRKERRINNPKPTSLEIDIKNGNKKCNKCSLIKTLDNFEYRKNINSYRGTCNECKCKERNKRREIKRGHPAREIYLVDIENNCKKCHNCKEVKTLDNFYHKSKITPNSYYYICKSCCIEKRKENFIKYKEKIKKYRKEYTKKPTFKMHMTITRGIWGALKRNKDNIPWKNLVDFNLKELMEHLQSNFKEGMTWDNYGDFWHIDHVLPKRLFKFTSFNDKEFKMCWSLNNLMPEYSMVNFSKQDRLDNDKKARSLTEEERLAYLRNKGFDV